MTQLTDGKFKRICSIIVTDLLRSVYSSDALDGNGNVKSQDDPQFFNAYLFSNESNDTLVDNLRNDLDKYFKFTSSVCVVLFCKKYSNNSFRHQVWKLSMILNFVYLRLAQHGDFDVDDTHTEFSLLKHNSLSVQSACTSGIYEKVFWFL